MCVTQGAISWHFSVAAVRGWCWILGAEACSDLRFVSTAVSELCRDSWEITKPHAHRSRDAQPPRSKFAAHVGPYSAHVALRRAHTLRSSVLIRKPGNTQRSPRAQIYSSRKQPHSVALRGKWPVRHLGNLREHRCGCPGLEKRTGQKPCSSRNKRDALLSTAVF